MENRWERGNSACAEKGYGVGIYPGEGPCTEACLGFGVAGGRAGGRKAEAGTTGVRSHGKSKQ